VFGTHGCFFLADFLSAFGAEFAACGDGFTAVGAGHCLLAWWGEIGSTAGAEFAVCGDFFAAFGADN